MIRRRTRRRSSCRGWSATQPHYLSRWAPVKAVSLALIWQFWFETEEKRERSASTPDTSLPNPMLWTAIASAVPHKPRYLTHKHECLVSWTSTQTICWNKGEILIFPPEIYLIKPLKHVKTLSTERDDHMWCYFSCETINRATSSLNNCYSKNILTMYWINITAKTT